jgi:hypothetical protein
MGRARGGDVATPRSGVAQRNFWSYVMHVHSRFVIFPSASPSAPWAPHGAHGAPTGPTGPTGHETSRAAKPIYKHKLNAAECVIVYGKDGEEKKDMVK